jgi:nitrate/TMAO reductase-like tetraheme cytochrome c subunit
MGRDRDKPPKSRVLLEVHIPRLWIGGLVAALALVLIGAVAGFSAVNRIETCGACHVIRAEVDTYKETAHHTAGVGCQQCHTKPGVFYYFVRNLQGLSNVFAHATDNYERPLTAYVGADTCTKCHSNDELEQDLVAGNMRINHSGLREAGYQCLTCHANISHPGTQIEVARLSQNVMAVCARCHDGETLPDDCDVCHLGAVPGDHEAVAMELNVSAKECRGCHEDEVTCRRCHNGLQMPHPSGWESRRHADVVLERKESVCVKCHTRDDASFCIDCHGLDMPHPSRFRGDHGEIGRADRKVCEKCHGTKSCITCHGIAMPHPGGFLSSHGGTALKSSAVCSRCHSGSYCSDCHGIAMPHPSGFLGSHAGTARSSPAVCSNCHAASSCTACHGVSLPHSSSFIAGHAQTVFSSGAVCVKCHGNRGSGPAGCYGGECHAAGEDFDL